ncbi:PREDICTED: protein RESTRICTED TEV MOVEMENT 2-like isoform X2 [Lupinus angustifolius]|uniref:protein RESTRICTED TEV MOVEMENT 2-like isoform X2 n=1 Tax=Lupinus angustifolius TaxID=3871 RepID=UPI00092E29A8|nr:PREDICTED: protein RESTRICTED TEV MOVEMENT 2-like isoform X2 [Lupinus angustifolius]XP_019453478.1 PREDICTED: protein RESTRICTED TEV MOVEMENT 2-like isoform X2 [Lupinus angustifolius]
MAMSMRPRTPTFRAPPRRVYETLQPKTEMKQSPEAYLLHIYLPGYIKERIKITHLSSSHSVKISGERPILGNRWSKFDQTYPLPKDCEAEKLQGKFEFGTLILTMPKKKTISQVSPKQEVKTNQEKDQPGPSQKPVPEKEKPENAKDTIPPQFKSHEVEEVVGDKKNASIPSPVKGSPDPAVVAEAKPKKDQDTIPFPPQFTTTKVKEPTGDKKSVSLSPSFVKGLDDLKFKAQKGTQEDTSSKRSIENLKPEDEKGLRGLIPQNSQAETVKKHLIEGKPKNGEEGFEPNPKIVVATKTKTDEKPQQGHQEEVEPKPTSTMVTRHSTKEKTMTEAAEKERVSKKEVKEDEKPYNMEKAIIKEKDTRASEVSHKELAEPSSLKAKEKRKEDMIDSVGSIGIRELAVSTCQVVTRIAEGKLNEEEKHLVVNMGAAALVIAALGAYVSYRFASSG